MRVRIGGSGDIPGEDEEVSSSRGKEDLEDGFAIKVQISRWVTVPLHEYSFQITHTARLIAMVMETLFLADTNPVNDIDGI